MAKYVLTQETLEIDGETLFRIKALVDIDRHDVKAGDYGGFVKCEANLSQKDDAWVGGRACVIGGRVHGNAIVHGDVIMRDEAEVFDEAEVGGRTDICGKAKIYGNAHIHNTVCIVKDSGTCGTLLYEWRDASWETNWNHIIISGETEIHGTADVTGNVVFRGEADICRGYFYGNATIDSGEVYDVETGATVVKAIIYNADKVACKEHNIPIVVPTIKVVTKSNLTDAVAAAVWLPWPYFILQGALARKSGGSFFGLSTML